MLYIGLMSGTSADGVDAVLVEIQKVGAPKLYAAEQTPYPKDLRSRILKLREGKSERLSSKEFLRQLGELDVAVGRFFGDCADRLKTGYDGTERIRAIGSHGQTLYHHPEGKYPFSLQIGNPAVIAARCGIATVADFRAADIAAGGQGAPLVPAFHRYLFHDGNQSRAIINIGGIANVTYLPADSKDPVIGFDIGPGNTLLDAWIQYQLGRDYDEKGEWAASGRISTEIIEILLADAYYKTRPPKSTGQEQFNLAWLQNGLNQLRHVLAPEDVQASLVALTVEAIKSALESFLPPVEEIFICGGGVENRFLMNSLSGALSGRKVESTHAIGLAPRWVEATAFAWLAHRRLEGFPGNVPSATGAKRAAILGAIYPAP